MYKFEIYRNSPYYRKGDLEEREELIKAEVYKTKKLAKAYIESKLKDRTNVYRNYRTGDTPSICSFTTNFAWIHENTGEKCYEYYKFVLRKI